ncbi:hypothetical protein [Kiloniella sp.]|uniref:hypothetical protein n=1 Tax=Kiloniella sp. TaxID=1938587 RepID=UPI003B02506A
MRLLFVTIADAEVGFGHLNRCLSIASTITTDQISAEFLVYGNNDVAAFMATKGYRYTVLPTNKLTSNTINLSNFAKKRFDVTLLDLVHSSFFNTTTRYERFFAEIAQTAVVIAVIDSLGEQSLAVRFPDAPIDLLILPYVMDSNTLDGIQKVGERQLHGAKYAFLAPPYNEITSRSVRLQADCVLITCGGSDPIAMTPAILEGLESLELSLLIRVVMGPFFDESLKSKINGLCSASKHQISLIDKPNNLAEHMAWCDLAISASGLTKYELAATGTPAILFSIDEFHDHTNSTFSGLGTALDIGVAPQTLEFAEKTLELLDNFLLRENMMQTGLKLFDGRGAHRLIAEFTKELTCKRKM